MRNIRDTIDTSMDAKQKHNVLKITTRPEYMHSTYIVRRNKNQIT